jgi:hypothetical protein
MPGSGVKVLGPSVRTRVMSVLCLSLEEVWCAGRYEQMLGFFPFASLKCQNDKPEQIQMQGQQQQQRQRRNTGILRCAQNDDIKTVRASLDWLALTVGVRLLL